MTVSSSTDRATFLGNNATTVFALPFRFFANGEINAWLITNATGALTALTLGTHYTLTGASDPEVDGSATGQLTMITPPTSAQSLFVQRIIPVTQPTDIVNQGRFFPEIHENVFDRLTMLNQQNAGALNRAIRVQDSDPEPAKLPSAAQRALKIMSFDADGNPVAIDAASDSSLVLRQDLANATDPAKGAGLVGLPEYGSTLDHAIYAVTPEMFGGIADAYIDDATGSVTGTDNTAAFVSALATGRPVVAARGGYLVSELALPSAATLLTAGESWLTGPLNKSVIKAGDSSGVSLTGITLDVNTRHPRLFNDVGVATTKGFPSGALVAGNTLTCGVSCENVKDSRIRVYHSHGYMGFKSVHSFDGSSTPPAPAIGKENENIELHVLAVGESWIGASVNIKNIRGGSIMFAGNTDNDGIKSAVGIGKGSSGQLDNVSVYGAFNGLVIEHEIPNLQIASVILKKQRSKNLVVSKGDQASGPRKVQIANLQILNGTSGTEISGVGVEAFDGEMSVGSAYIENTSTYGVRLTSGSKVSFGRLEGKNCQLLAFNNACTLSADKVSGSDMGSLVATGGAAITDIALIRSLGGITGHLFNGGSNGVHHIGEISGPSSGGGVTIGTGSAGSSFNILDMSETSTGFISNTIFSSLTIGRIITQAGVIEEYFAPGIKRLSGTGSPEGVVSANTGSEYTRLDPVSQSTLKYFKVTGTGSTGWVALSIP